MRSAFFWLLSFCGFAAVTLVCGLLAWPQLSPAWLSIREQIDRFRRMPPLVKLALIVFAGVFFVYGSVKPNEEDQTSGTNIVEIVEGGTNDIVIVEGGTNGVEIVDGDATNTPPMMLTMVMPFSNDQPPTVTPDDVARGWQQVEVRTNCNISYAMSEGATLATNWWVRGAYEDVKPFDFGNWRFPFGTNEYSSLWAFSWGKIRFTLADTNEIVAVGAPMSAVPYRSRLWAATDTNGSQLVTWENFTLGRATLQSPVPNPQSPVSAQIELRTTGDFVTRSNEVETVCRRVDPDDYDGDGWRNGDDPDPYNWDEFGDYFYQEPPAGANEDAYCWVDIRPRWNSYICFYGDAPSDLEDPYVWAKAGETYRVQLLIGKTYTVVSPYPVDVVGRSDPSIEVDGDGTCELEIVWPVSFSAMEGNGANFMMRVVPAGLGGTFEWTQHCCAITGYGNQFWWAHDRYCYCGGCYASGWYSYEGYALWCEGGHCCCPHENDDDDPYEPQEDDGPYAAGASVEFSKSAVIFEDAYTNMPGEVVARRSTQTTLTCVAHGGETGGTATFSIENDAKLVSCSGGALPVMRFVPPQQKIEFEIVYEGRLPSGGERDIIAKADFAERGTGTRHSTVEDVLTSVKVELETKYSARDNSCKMRHVYGVAETVYQHCYPVIDSGLWTVTIDGRSAFLVQDGQPGFCASWTAGNGIASYSVLGVSYSTEFNVLEPEVEVRNARANQFGVSPVIGESGHLLLFLDQYVAPYYVSFREIYMMEIPDESNNCQHSGYFDNSSTGPWSHTSQAGAGNWNPVGVDGYWGYDKAGHAGAYGEPWSEGEKEWDIPIGWGFGGQTVVGSIHPNPTKQKFVIHSNGTFKITKHGHSAERNTFGLIWVDDSLVWWPW